MSPSVRQGGPSLGTTRPSRLGLAAAALMGATPVAGLGSEANDTAAPQYQVPSYEITPFAGFRIGGSFKQSDTGASVDLDDHASFALALGLRAEEAGQYELFYSRESTVMRSAPAFTPASLTVEYLHIGGTLLVDDELRLKPYILGGLGITRFSPPAQGTQDTQFSLSAGLGLRWPINRHFSVRLEGRGFVTLVDPDTAEFCRSDQAGLLCRIHGHGRTFVQGELLMGAAFAF